MDAILLENILLETEAAHAASGHDAKDWAKWYAEYILKHYDLGGSNEAQSHN